ncbi:MAG: YggT family protein [Pelagibacteraceae bacterium]|tara:strand:- start:173 stop:460 length:288 start_codon:yes stop_codon:yes gene_type:complete
MNSLIILIDNIIYLYSIVLIVNILLSWLTAFNIINTGNRFVYAVLDASHKLTDPLLNPIRRFMPNIAGLDFSPIILFLLLGFCRNLLREYGMGLL